jgi:primosomal replication protein N
MCLKDRAKWREKGMMMMLVTMLVMITKRKTGKEREMRRRVECQMEWTLEGNQAFQWETE